MQKLIDLSSNVFKSQALEGVEIQMCEHCKTPRQVLVNILGVKKICNCLCHCQAEALRKNDQEQIIRQQKQRMENLRHKGIADPQHQKYTFKNDDNPKSEIARKAYKYAERFKEMYEKNCGLMLYGGVGTGKSFYACCIANILIDQGISALVTSMPRIMYKMRSMSFEEDKNMFIDSIERYSLVVIDDLGVENPTDFAHETMFQVLDARVRSKKPLIITTNLDPKDFNNPKDERYNRLFDRIRECCVPILVDGSSRRREIMKDKSQWFEEMMGG